MAQCEVCGNDYEMAFEIHIGGDSHVFDSFECAIHRLAPVCEHCGCKVVGHGVQAAGKFFCCAHCARMSGERAVSDHQNERHQEPQAEGGQPTDKRGVTVGAAERGP